MHQIDYSSYYIQNKYLFMKTALADGLMKLVTVKPGMYSDVIKENDTYLK